MRECGVRECGENVTLVVPEKRNWPEDSGTKGALRLRKAVAVPGGRAAPPEITHRA